MSVSLASEGWHYLRDQQGTLTEELQTTRKQGSRAELKELLLKTQLVTVSALCAAQLRRPAGAGGVLDHADDACAAAMRYAL